MYFVDREKIEQLLQLIENNLKIIKEQPSWQGMIEKLALERIVHLLIETVLDVGNHLIDGFIMRDPGSYEDIIDILLDEKVISAEDEAPLKEIIAFRKMLVQNYEDIDHGQVLQGLQEHKAALEVFPNKVRKYLENELGSITTFKR
ncbi:type VII toxin-antitoxin system HepT family RNase toxin [Schinkia sp. CFF1]